MKNHTVVGYGVGILCLLAFLGNDAHAQAWVPPKKTATAGITYSYGASNKIVYEGDSNGQPDVLLDNHAQRTSRRKHGETEKRVNGTESRYTVYPFTRVLVQARQESTRRR